MGDERQPSANSEASADSRSSRVTFQTPQVRTIQVALVERTWWKSPQLLIALGGFGLSVALAISSVLAGLRGSEIGVEAPNTILLYRDGKPDSGVLKIGLSVHVINASAGYGDALKDATISASGRTGKWRVESEGRWAITSDESTPQAECPPQSNCIRLGNFRAVEQDFGIVSLPGGDAKTLNLVFALVPSHCIAKQAHCELKMFNEQVANWTTPEMVFRVMLSFHGDGEHEFSCYLYGLDKNYLVDKGWTSRSCREKDKVIL